jgi:PTH1 family peptidyl-tRNA hydrolase
VVGIGNPGRRYWGTRHNVGFVVMNLLAETRPWEASATYLASVRQFSWCQLVVAKPTTFVNDSGDAVVDLLCRYPMDLDDILVIVDDVHLDVGRLRLRRGGSDGGHNGLRSIIASTGSRDFARLRFGVGTPPAESTLIDHVLGTFGSRDRLLVEEAAGRAIQAIVGWSRDGIERTMNLVNGIDDTQSGPSGSLE